MKTLAGQLRNILFGDPGFAECTRQAAQLFPLPDQRGQVLDVLQSDPAHKGRHAVAQDGRIKADGFFQRQRTRSTVGQMITRRQRERTGVYHRVLGQLKSHARQRRGVAHRRTGRSVVRILRSASEMPADQPRRLDGQQIADRLVPARPVAFDGVAERVQAGDHGDAPRQRIGQLRIHDRVDGIERVAGNRPLALLVRIVQHGKGRDLRAGSGRRRHGDQRQTLCAQRHALGMNGSDTRQICHGQARSRLGTIHRAAAADGDYDIVLLAAQSQRQRIDTGHRGVRGHLGKHRYSGQSVLDGRPQRQSHQVVIGHHERTLAGSGSDRRNLPNSALAKRHGGRNLECPHAVRSLSGGWSSVSVSIDAGPAPRRRQRRCTGPTVSSRRPVHGLCRPAAARSREPLPETGRRTRPTAPRK